MAVATVRGIDIVRAPRHILRDITNEVGDAIGYDNDAYCRALNRDPGGVADRFEEKYYQALCDENGDET